ncbi:efflux RND transporter periplasmic adaptor subunit [Methylocella sp.]|uniref:efflux RND transporter periplasmic adaptor subunit n=1 Tax=Methylocella sp. TaxID=1978226 RepID=UPI003784A26B
MRPFLSWLGRVALTGGVLVVALIFGAQLWAYYVDAPWTRDGRVKADIVAVAPDVSGLVTDVFVHDNEVVTKGQPLFRIDRDRFELAVRQAEAALEGRAAAFDEAADDLTRYSQLSDRVVSRQKYEQALSAKLRAESALGEAKAQLDLAKLNLERSEVRASVNGAVTNLDLRPGAYVSAGKGVFALVDADSLRVEGYFEETKLPRIHVGDRAEIRLMGEDKALTGRVESVAAAIDDRERRAGESLVANVNPTFAWVRLAQRVPVRVTLDATPAAIRLVPGRTATVSIDEKTSANRTARPAGPPSSWRDALRVLGLGRTL